MLLINDRITMKPKKIEWIFFDVGGVLTDDRKAEQWRINTLTAIAKRYKPTVTKKKIEQLHQLASKMPGSINRNVFTILLRNKKQAARAAAELYSRRQQELDYAAVAPIRPKTLKVVKLLAKKYSLGLIANQPKVTKERLRKAGLKKYFSHLSVSKDYKASKPDKELFLRIFKEAGANPKYSAVIDDNPERGLLPAKKLGMTTVWYKHNYWGSRNFITNCVDCVVTEFDALLDIFMPEKSNNYFVIIRGPLGVGKTTIAKLLAKKLKAKYFAVDRVLDRYNLTKDKEGGYISQKSFLQANKIIVPVAKKSLAKNIPVIFDGNFYWQSQIKDLIKKMGTTHFVFTLKAPLSICIKRDIARSKTHGPLAAKAVYRKSTEFSFGTVIDATKPRAEIIDKILHFIYS